jgi:hypothetical protein
MEIFKAVIRTVTLPIQIVKDVLAVVEGEEPDHTQDTIEAIKNDIIGE